MIDVCCTYETWTDEDAELGETDKRGFLWENYPHTFRELVGLMQEHQNPSTFPVDPTDGRVWFTCYDDIDFRTGERTCRSIHLSNPDNPRHVRYWIKAWRTADRFDHRGEPPAA